MRLSLLTAAVLAAALLPVGSATAALAASTTPQAPNAATATCQETLDGVYCGYDRSNAYTDRGDSGARVKEVQALLIYHGYSVGSTGVDGQFGAGTESAVKRFQTAKHLTVDGKVGANTWSWLRTERYP
ncbi:peptidoglycan-binding protein [Streptomyces sp. NPDC051109]|uniref:peptidoglycan-binding protein n=1 Tax=Streptomyces sp. NPDC051109 TaxID=3365642 RepID=UPI0037AD94E4